MSPPPRGRHYNLLVLRAFCGRPPSVHVSAFVDQSAQVIGDVRVGPECSIWMNVVARGDVNAILIGTRTNVQDGTIVHVQRETRPTTIGDEVTIGHGVIVHGCAVEDRCLIGMGAILLNGCRIGTGSIVAAGTLVPEGMEVPPGSKVMGVPAKVRCPVTADEQAAIIESAASYAQYRLHYMPEGASV